MAGPRRTRLRTRILSISIGYALLLIAVAFLLTWRARESQRELGRIVDTELRAASELEQLLRIHNGYMAQWVAHAKAGTLATFGMRYGVVRQAAETRALSRAAPAIGPRLAALESRIESISASAPDGGAPLDPADVAEVDAWARTVSAEIGAATRDLRRAADERLRVLDARAGGLMATALGVTWMIAVVTLALARLALVKIVRPIERLSDLASEIARAPSETTRRAPISGDREIALLAADFNAMIDAIAERDAELQRRSVTDELTAMPNFRAFQERIADELARADRYAHPLGLLVFDLDRFKKYNDAWGHLAGNEALAAVAAVIREKIRGTDFCARYGGEEFAAILTETDLAGVRHLAERIRAAVEGIPPIEGRTPLTISIGGAMFPEDGTTAEELFAAADQRLYEAKELGRNRVVVPGR